MAQSTVIPIMSRLYASGKRVVHALALLVWFSPMQLAAESGEIAQPVRIGDIVFAIPAALKPSLDPSSAYDKIRFDYSKIDSKGEPSGVWNVDGVFIKLENLWPLSEDKRGAVLAIHADRRQQKSICFVEAQAGSAGVQTRAKRLEQMGSSMCSRSR